MHTMPDVEVLVTISVDTPEDVHVAVVVDRPDRRRRRHEDSSATHHEGADDRPLGVPWRGGAVRLRAERDRSLTAAPITRWT